MREVFMLTWQLWIGFMRCYHRFIAGAYYTAMWIVILSGYFLGWITASEYQWCIIGGALVSIFFYLWSYSEFRKIHEKTDEIRRNYFQSVQEIQAEFNQEVQRITQSIIQRELEHSVQMHEVLQAQKELTDGVE